MSESKGPKLSVPDGLMEELDESVRTQPDLDTPSPSEAEESAAGANVSADAPEFQKELDELKDRHLRLAADFDNYKRRTLKERQDLHNYANEGLIKELLATVDNLERAVEHARKEESAADMSSFMEGVELTYRSLLNLLDKSDVRVVDPSCERFDPQVHEAMRQVPSSDVEPGSVVEVYQKGYLLKDRLLRPALVAVSSRPEPGDDNDPKPDEIEP